MVDAVEAAAATATVADSGGRLGMRATVNEAGQHEIELFDGAAYRRVHVEGGHRLVDWVRAELRKLHDALLGHASDPQPENDPGCDGDPAALALTIGAGSVPAPALDPSIPDSAAPHSPASADTGAVGGPASAVPDSASPAAPTDAPQPTATDAGAASVPAAPAVPAVAEAKP